MGEHKAPPAPQKSASGKLQVEDITLMGVLNLEDLRVLRERHSGECSGFGSICSQSRTIASNNYFSFL